MKSGGFHVKTWHSLPTALYKNEEFFLNYLIYKVCRWISCEIRWILWIWAFGWSPSIGLSFERPAKIYIWCLKCLRDSTKCTEIVCLSRVEIKGVPCLEDWIIFPFVSTWICQFGQKHEPTMRAVRVNGQITEVKQLKTKVKISKIVTIQNPYI